MEIIKSNLEELMEKAGYSYEQVYEKYLKHGITLLKHPDPQVETLRNYWFFFDEKEEEIQKLTGASLERILFSKYYWAVKYTRRYQDLEGWDAGTDQARFFVFEEVLNRLDLDEINWDVLQAIHENRYD